MTSTPPLAPPETGKPHPWSCPACTFRNKATDKQCEVCKHARPAQRPNSAALGILFQVHDSHHRTPEFEQPFGLEGLTVTTTLGFLRDLIEAKTGIADRHQKLVFRGVELTASAETLLVDALDDLKPFDVISVLRVEDEPSNDDAGWGDDMDAEQTPQRETSEDPFESAQTGDDGWGQDNADSGWGTVTADDGQWQPEDKMDESGGADDEEKTDESDDFSSRAFYNLLTATELEELCHMEVKELSELMGTSADDTGTLLRHFSWAKVQLTEMFVNNPKKVLDSLGPLGEETSTSTSTLFDCPLCADSQIPLYETTALRCAHRYCNTCWKGWITAAFDNGKTMISTNCPAVKCKVIVPASVMKKFLEPAQGHKLDEWYLENFVQNRKDLKWCPFPGCSRAAQALSPNAVVACSCDFTWCFSCQQPDHRPLTCQLAETWNQKNSSDSENVTWIMANTKKCPNCQVSIEKNQGCNHMTCRRCKHEFCWLCKADWKGHSSCAQFQGNDNNKKAKEAHSEQKEIEKAKDELNRYMHYFERYNNHFNAIKHAKAIREKTQLRMEEMQKLKGTGSRDVKYLLDAVNAVISCHHTLQWTYAYGYYLDRKSKTKDLFESNQTSLEQFTDSLHEMTEQPLENLIEGKEKINIVSYTRLVQKFRRNVISAIRSGYQH